MDAKWARELIEQVCSEIANRKREHLRRLRPLGVGVALGLAVAGCETDDGETDTSNQDVVQEVSEDGVDDTMAADAYGVPIDTVDAIVEAYGVPMDTAEDDTLNLDSIVEAYGVPMDTVDDTMAADAYGVPMDTVDDGTVDEDGVETDTGSVDLYGMADQ